MNRERAAVKHTRDTLHRFFLHFFAQQAPLMAKRVVAAYQHISKGEEDHVQRILNAVPLHEWAKHLANDPTLIAALRDMTLDGEMQAFYSLGMNNSEPTDQVNDFAVQYASDRAAGLVGMQRHGDIAIPNPDPHWRIDESTREYLRADVTQALEEGWSNDTLAHAIEQNYAFSDARAQTIARTETAMADSAGNMNAYRLSGVVTGKKWLLGPDSCEVCQANADQGVIDLNENFDSGDDAAPAHPNCTCDVIPITDEEMN